MHGPLTEDEAFLIESLTLILESELRIHAHPLMAQAVTPALGLSFVLFGGGQIPIGLALQGWRDGELRTSCLHCQEKAYVFYIRGSPLSGASHWRGHCLGCQKSMDGSLREVLQQGLRFSNRLQAAGAMNRGDDPIALESGLVIETTEPSGEKKEVRLFFTGEGVAPPSTNAGPKRMDFKTLVSRLKMNPS
jgi:hypothetical protein